MSRLAPWLLAVLVGSVGGGASPLQDRIDAAVAGAVITVEAGSSAGPLVIRKRLTLRGLEHPLIEGDGRGHVVQILADDVVLEGFRIEHSGFDLSADHAGVWITGNRAVVRSNRIQRVLHGIYVKGANEVRIEGNEIDGLVYVPEATDDVLREGFSSRPTALCTVELGSARRGNGIHLWNGAGHQILANRIRRTRDGIYFSFTSRSWVYRNDVSEVRYGLHYMYSDSNTFEENRFRENAAGAAIMYSEDIRAFRNDFLSNRGKRAYGLLMQSVDNSTFEDNTLRGNTIGWYLENSQQNRFRGNRVERNYVGLRFSSSSADNLFAHNTFRQNLHPVEMDQRVEGNVWSEGGRGNDWGTTGSPDLDGDGVGEWSHFEGDVLGRYRRDHELIGLLSGSAFIDLLRFAGSRSAAALIPRIEDPRPLLPRD